MSAEGKKKRGEAGMSNAKNIPFRYHGRYPRGYHDKPVFKSEHPFGVTLPGFTPSERLLRMTDAAMERCTSSYLR